jgi:3-oxoacyl-(acyl-carrier-protein) synthase
MCRNEQRRVVVTGLGVVAPNGLNRDAFWRATLQGVSGIKSLRYAVDSSLAIRVAGEILDVQPELSLGRKLVQRTDRMTHLAMMATAEALRDAQLDVARENPQRIGTVIANTLGGVDFTFEQVQALYTRGPRSMSAYTSIAWIPAANIGQVAVRYNLQGYSKTPSNTTVGGLDAVCIATQAIKRSVADVLITGGCEAFLHPLLLELFARDEMFIQGDDLHAYRPFDQRASGMIFAEGAGICILEEYEHARRRHAPIYGEILGYAHTNDAYGMHHPTLETSWYAQAIRLALQDAQLQPEDIAYFSLDGRALPLADQIEADALHSVFGDAMATLLTSVPRTLIGHSFAAAGVLDTITTLLALRDQCIPPTYNCEQFYVPYQLNLVRDQPQPFNGSQALIGGRGLGGSNIVLVLAKSIDQE